jgi:DNA (cytosine-5)-methyltransferase 1
MTTIDLCAGPGGMAIGAQILGVRLDRDACDTGRAAGHIRQQADIRTINPDHPEVTGAIVTTPCPPFSRGGKRLGIRDM